MIRVAYDGARLLQLAGLLGAGAAVALIMLTGELQYLGPAVLALACDAAAIRFGRRQAILASLAKLGIALIALSIITMGRAAPAELIIPRGAGLTMLLFSTIPSLFGAFARAAR